MALTKSSRALNVENLGVLDEFPEVPLCRVSALALLATSLIMTRYLKRRAQAEVNVFCDCATGKSPDVPTGNRREFHVWRSGTPVKVNHDNAVLRWWLS